MTAPRFKIFDIKVEAVTSHQWMETAGNLLVEPWEGVNGEEGGVVDRCFLVTIRIALAGAFLRAASFPRKTAIVLVQPDALVFGLEAEII